jgi:sister-chromatid-cohesion protein PDS5
MEDIMILLIEISTTITPPIFQYLLSSVTNPKKSPIAFSITKTVLSKTTEYISQPLGEQLNNELERYLSKKASVKETSALAKAIVTLTTITCRLLLHTIPVLINYMKDENLSHRQWVIQLLVQMFAHPDSNMIEEYQELFKSFIERYKDKDNAVRIIMARFMQDMLLNHGAQQSWIVEIINNHLVDRLRDPEEKVRLIICEAIINVMKTNVDLIQLSTALELKERLRDKKQPLRMHVMKLLCEVWRQHDGAGEKVEWIPQAIVHASAVLQQFNFLEQCIEKHLLAEDDSPEDQQRAISFVMFLEQIDKFHTELLKKRLFEQKTRFRLVLKRFISLVEGGKDLDVDEKKMLDQSILALVQNFPERDQRQSVSTWQAIRAKKEAWKILKQALEPTSTQEDLDEIRKKIEEKNYLGKAKEANEYLLAIFNKASFSLITTRQIEQLLDIYIGQPTNTDVLNALLFCAECFPFLFVKSYKQLAEILKQSDEVAIAASLKILLSVGPAGTTLEEIASKIARNLEPRLLDLAQTGSPRIAKYASRAISKLFVTPSLLYSTLYDNLRDQLQYNKNTPAVLSSLSEIAIHDVDTFSNNALEIVDFIIDDIILKVRENEKPSTKRSLNLSCQSRILGFKVLQNYLHSLAKSDTMSVDGNEILKRAQELFWNVFEYGGNILALNANKPKRAFDSAIKAATARVTDDDEEMEEADVKEEYEGEDSFGNYDAAMLRLASVKGILELASSNPQELNLTHDRFLRLGYSVLDSYKDVRAGVAKHLHQKLCTAKLGNRFLAMLLLGVTDPLAEQAGTVKKYLTEAVMAVRKEIKRASPDQHVSLDSEGSFSIFPEYALPYLIYLLAHHPEFDKKAPDFVDFQKILFSYFDAVTEGEVDNQSFLQGLISRIKTRKDGSVPNSTNHLVICDLSVIILPRCAHGKPVTVAYPGKYFIPSLFKIDNAEMETPRRSTLETPRTSETPTNPSAMKNLRTLYLSKEFKLHEKLARNVGTPAPATAKKSAAATGGTETSTTTKKKQTKKKGEASTTTKKRKRTATKASPRKKQKTLEEVTQRTSLARSAKTKTPPAKPEESASEQEEEEAPKARTSRKLTYESDEEEDNKEEEKEEEDQNSPETTATTRRRRRSKT